MRQRFFEVTRGHLIIAGPRTIASIPAFANEDRTSCEIRSEKAEERREHDEGACGQQAGPNDRADPGFRETGAYQTAYKGVRTAGRYARPPR